MSSDQLRKKLAEMGQVPGLTAWHKKGVLLLRCGDITKDFFLERVWNLRERVESLFENSLPESMEQETYLMAKEYYDKASEGLDCYLSGLDALIGWADSGNESLLEIAANHFLLGDRHSTDTYALQLDVQDSLRDAEDAVMRSVGLDPEGIG